MGHVFTTPFPPVSVCIVIATLCDRFEERHIDLLPILEAYITLGLIKISVYIAPKASQFMYSGEWAEPGE